MSQSSNKLLWGCLGCGGLIALTGCASLIILAALGHMVGSRTQGDAQPQANENRQTANKPDVLLVSTNELLHRYATDERSANTAYKDRIVEIEAVVVKGTDNVETTRLIVSSEKDGPSIVCVFDKEWSKELATVQVGQKRRIRGRCMGRISVSVWLTNCSFPGASPASPKEVRTNEQKSSAKQDMLLKRLKTDKGPVFDCALDAIKKELPKRFGRENSKDALIPTDHKQLRLEKLDPSMRDDQGREDVWVVHGSLISKGKDGKKYKMLWEVTVTAIDGELSAGLVGIKPQP